MDPSARREDPVGASTARLITFVAIVVTPFSMLGVFAVGGSVDCDARRDALICSSPDLWTVLTLSHVVAMLVILTALVVGTRVRIRHHLNPMAWAVGWAGAGALVLMATWWVSTG